MNRFYQLLAALAVFVFFNCKNTAPAAPKVEETAVFTDNQFTSNIEGPDVDRDGNLYVVNYLRDGTIARVYPDGKCEIFVELPEGSIANSIKFDSKNNMLLADWPMHNILRVDMSTKNVAVFCHDERFNQPNDLCINKKDQLFASDPKWKDGTGQIWRIDPDGKAVLLETGMGTANGIELSPDEKKLYVAESVQRKVWQYDLDAAGNLSNKRLLIEFSDFGLDGMKCDRLGNLYLTRYDKGTIAVVSPTGRLIHEIVLKGKKCSNLVFGGKEGVVVYVTLQDSKCMEIFRNDIPGRKY